MGWALVILFLAAVVLLILSIILSKKSSDGQLRENELLTASFMKEIGDLEDQVRNLELDMEILTEQAAIKSSSQERLLLREVLDLHRRKYSIHSIAEKTNLSENEIETMLTPFKRDKAKRGNVANER